MISQRYVHHQCKAMNIMLGLTFALMMPVWLATICDQLLHIGFGWDRQLLWLAPSAIIFVALFRIFCIAIFRFAAGMFKGG